MLCFWGNKTHNPSRTLMSSGGSVLLALRWFAIGSWIKFRKSGFSRCLQPSQHLEVRATCYHPRINRFVETTNCTLKATFQAIVNHYRTDEWDKYLPPIILTYGPSTLPPGFLPRICKVVLCLFSEINPSAANALGDDRHGLIYPSVARLVNPSSTANTWERPFGAATSKIPSVGRQVGPRIRSVLLHQPRFAPSTVSEIRQPNQGPFLSCTNAHRQICTS